jgi:hypothetical protein
MHLPQNNIKRFVFRSTSLLLLSLTITCQVARSQFTDTLTDSVKTTDNGENSELANGASKTTDTTVPEQTVWRAVPGLIADSLKRTEDFEYANDPAYLRETTIVYKKGPWDYFWELITSKAMSILFYVMMAAVLLFAFYKIIVENKLYLFYSNSGKTEKTQLDESSQDPEDIERNIRESLLAEDYRSAIRYMHIKTLQLLDEKELIRFHPQLTNQQYASQLRGTKFETRFQYLTNVYNHVWFGGFEINRQQAAVVQENFNNFYSAVQD